MNVPRYPGDSLNKRQKADGVLTFQNVNGKSELVKSVFFETQVPQRQLTLSDSIIDLVHIKVLDIWSENSVEQLGESMSAWGS